MKWKSPSNASSARAWRADVVRVFVRLGWEIARQSGSHIILVKPDNPASLSVPNHEEVARGTLRSLIRRAGLTVEEFIASL